MNKLIAEMGLECEDITDLYNSYINIRHNDNKIEVKQTIGKEILSLIETAFERSVKKE